MQTPKRGAVRTSTIDSRGRTAVLITCTLNLVYMYGRTSLHPLTLRLATVASDLLLLSHTGGGCVAAWWCAGARIMEDAKRYGVFACDGGVAEQCWRAAP